MPGIRRLVPRTSGLSAQPSHPCSTTKHPGVLARATAELSSLHLVARALTPPTSLGKGAAAADSDETEVARALQAARAGAWVATQGWGARAPPRFASEAEWRSVAARRRAAAAAATPGGTAFFADACAGLAGLHACPAISYPAPSLERLIQSLFLAGASGSAALHAKLMLLAFHLADGGWCGRRELLDQLEARMLKTPHLIKHCAG